LRAGVHQSDRVQLARSDFLRAATSAPLHQDSSGNFRNETLVKGVLSGIIARAFFEHLRAAAAQVFVWNWNLFL